MSEKYRTIVGRIGIILLLTGVVVLLVGYFRSAANLNNRIDSTMVTYIGVGLVVVGAILTVVFIADFLLKQRKHQAPTNKPT